MFLSKINNAAVAVVMTVLTIFSTTSCKKDEPAKTIADIVIADAQFSVLKNALTKANLVTLLQGAGTYTVFAPTNAALAAVGIDQAYVDAATAVQLVPVLSYHVLPKKITAAEIATANNTEVATLLGTVYVTKNAAGVSINGAKVTTADVTASNGVIHIIDRALVPPSQDIVAYLQGKSDYSLLVAAVVKTNLVGTLQGPGPLTVLAPNNAAFAALAPPFSTLAGINNATAAQVESLKNILLYHVIGVRAFSTNLTAGALPTAFPTKSVTIDLTNGVKVIGGTAANVANVVTSPADRFNILTTNGVIHTIDKVLIP